MVVVLLVESPQCYHQCMKVAGEILIVGATMRLIRLVVTDDLGRWLIRQPANRWANYAESTSPSAELDDPPEPENGWRSKLVSGLDCPFCVGFWIGLFVLLSYAAVGRTSLWRFVAAAFTLNEVAAHVGARLGDAGYVEE